MLFYVFFVAKMALQAQTTNTWSQLNDFIGQGRTDAVAFVISNKAYVGTGLNSAGQPLNDFWVYNPVADTWTQRQNAGGIGRWAAVGFGIGSKGYLGTGYIGLRCEEKSLACLFQIYQKANTSLEQRITGKFLKSA